MIIKNYHGNNVSGKFISHAMCCYFRGIPVVHWSARTNWWDWYLEEMAVVNQIVLVFTRFSPKNIFSGSDLS